MGRYLIRRTLFLLLVIVIVSFLVFVIFLKLPPGDPARIAAGRRTSPHILETIRHNFGLDQPWYVQYARFAKGMVPWPGFFLDEDIYYSYSNQVAVKDEVFNRLPVTGVLALGAAVIWLVIGIPIGIASAIKPRSARDRAGMLFALFGVSAPVFWLAYILLFIFWFKLQILPGTGLPLDESLMESVLKGRFVLPWITLALLFAAFYARMVRSNMIETMSEDFIRTARAKGLSERRVIFKHGLRAALTPIVTMLGLDIALLFGGALVTETVFNLPGINQYLLNSLQTNDFPAVMGVTLFVSLIVAVANLVVDVAYAAVDPRVRYT